MLLSPNKRKRPQNISNEHNLISQNSTDVFASWPQIDKLDQTVKTEVFFCCCLFLCSPSSSSSFFFFFFFTDVYIIWGINIPVIPITPLTGYRD